MDDFQGTASIGIPESDAPHGRIRRAEFAAERKGDQMDWGEFEDWLKNQTTENLQREARKFAQKEMEASETYANVNCPAVVGNSKNVEMIGTVYGTIGYLAESTGWTPAMVVGTVMANIGNMASVLGADSAIRNATQQCERIKNVAEHYGKQQMIAESALIYKEDLDRYQQEVASKHKQEWYIEYLDGAMYRMRKRLHELEPRHFPKATVRYRQFADDRQPSEARMRNATQYVIDLVT